VAVLPLINTLEGESSRLICRSASMRFHDRRPPSPPAPPVPALA
jgi:hypothetical protein